MSSRKSIATHSEQAVMALTSVKKASQKKWVLVKTDHQTPSRKGYSTRNKIPCDFALVWAECQNDCMIRQKGGRSFTRLDKILHPCFYFGYTKHDNLGVCNSWVHGPFLDNFIANEDDYKNFSRVLNKCFLCRYYLQFEYEQIKKYYSMQSPSVLRQDTSAPDFSCIPTYIPCHYIEASCFQCCCVSPTIQCSTCNNWIHHECYTGFLSLLTKACQRNFSLVLYCSDYIINQLKWNSIIAKDAEGPGYQRLFLYDFCNHIQLTWYCILLLYIYPLRSYFSRRHHNQQSGYGLRKTNQHRYV